MSRKSRFASGSLRRDGPIRLSERVASRVASGWTAQVVPVREPEQPDEVDRIALEGIPRRNVDAVVVDDEVVAFERAAAAAAKAAEHAVEHRTALGLARLEFGADDGGEVADILGDARSRTS